MCPWIFCGVHKRECLTDKRGKVPPHPTGIVNEIVCGRSQEPLNGAFIFKSHIKRGSQGSQNNASGGLLFLSRHKKSRQKKGAAQAPRGLWPRHLTLSGINSPRQEGQILTTRSRSLRNQPAGMRNGLVAWESHTAAPTVLSDDIAFVQFFPLWKRPVPSEHASRGRD